jgi:hypothetical protein
MAESQTTLKIIELTERLMADAELRPGLAQSGCSSSSGGVGNSSSTSGSALANLTASLIGSAHQIQAVSSAVTK